MTWNLRNLLVGIVNVALAIISFFIGIRIVLKFFAANPQTPFVNWIYQVSGDIIYPFTGIFPNLQIDGSAVFDIVALITLIAYMILGYVVIALIDTSLTAIRNRRHIHEHPVV